MSVPDRQRTESSRRRGRPLAGPSRSRRHSGLGAGEDSGPGDEVLGACHPCPWGAASRPPRGVDHFRRRWMFSLAAVPCARLVEVTTSSFTRCRFAAELPFRQARAMSSWRRKRPSMAADGCRSVPYSAWGRSRCTASMVQARQLDETGEIIISGHAQTDDVSVTSELAVWSAGGEVEGTASLQGPWESAARERGFRLVPVPASSPPSQPGPLSDPHLIPPPAPAFPLTSQPTLEAPAGETPDGLLQHPPQYHLRRNLRGCDIAAQHRNPVWVGPIPSLAGTHRR